MIGINKCLSVKLCILLTWLQSSWKPIEVYVLEVGVNRKFDFRPVWKFCWDLSNVISGGKCVFPGGTLDPSGNYNLLIGISYKHHLLSILVFLPKIFETASLRKKWYSKKFKCIVKTADLSGWPMDGLKALGSTWLFCRVAHNFLHKFYKL